jgi:hypothetical protein
MYHKGLVDYIFRLQTKSYKIQEHFLQQCLVNYNLGFKQSLRKRKRIFLQQCFEDYIRDFKFETYKTPEHFTAMPSSNYIFDSKRNQGTHQNILKQCLARITSLISREVKNHTRTFYNNA